MKLSSMLVSTKGVTGGVVAKSIVVVVAGVVGMTLVSTGVSATLDAISSNASPQQITSGTLKLVQVDNGSGFATPIAGVAPGDTVVRFVNYSNSGTLGAQTLSLSAADSVSSRLTTDGSNGLQVTVSSCSVAWIPATGTCPGTTSNLLSNTSVASLKTATVPLLSGAINPGDVEYLKFAIVLPDQTEETVNGVLPANTIQGLSANITWTLREVQAAGATKNS